MEVATQPEDIASIATRARELGQPLRVLGGGSNLVVSDDGVRACVIDMQIRGVSISSVPSPNPTATVEVVAGAGEPWDELVATLCGKDLAGLECLSGIPGSVGATPIQNVGAYGQEVGDCLRWVEAFDLEQARTVRLSRDECELGYRESRFKQRERDRWIVTRVCFHLVSGGAPSLRYAELHRSAQHLGDAPSLSAVRDLVLRLRRSKSMVLEPGDENRRSCGSFFTNPLVSAAVAEQVSKASHDQGTGAPPQFPQENGQIKLSAGWLIEKSGLSRGLRDGAVGISTNHALQLVAHDGATAADAVRFARRVQRHVEAHWGVLLTPEPVFWGFERLEAGLPVI